VASNEGVDAKTRVTPRLVAELRDAFGRYSADEPLRELIEDLRALSRRFE
jgi:MmyB-like transcription regulator ligand binding domain